MASNRTDLSNAHWLKSSYSNGDGGECVEVAPNLPGTRPRPRLKGPAPPRPHPHRPRLGSLHHRAQDPC